MFSKKESAFTLIELLIVVGIIALLASVVLIGLGPARVKGRDTRRIADLREVQQGLEVYHSKNGTYPVVNPGVGSWDNLKSALISSGVASAVPQDPSAGKSYLYGVAGDGQDYVLGAVLEDSANPALNNSAKGSWYGVDCSGGTYCLKF